MSGSKLYRPDSVTEGVLVRVEIVPEILLRTLRGFLRLDKRLLRKKFERPEYNIIII